MKTNKTDEGYEKNNTKLHLFEFIIKIIFRLYPAMWVIYLIFGGNVLTFLKEATLFISSGEDVHKIPID